VLLFTPVKNLHHRTNHLGRARSRRWTNWKGFNFETTMWVC